MLIQGLGLDSASSPLEESNQSMLSLERVLSSAANQWWYHSPNVVHAAEILRSLPKCPSFSVMLLEPEKFLGMDHVRGWPIPERNLFSRRWRSVDISPSR
jgi:hypothetical protein